MSNTEEKRGRYGPMLDRLKIIVLGLMLGVGARYVVRYWPANAAAKNSPAGPAKTAPAAVPPSAQGS